MGQDGTRLSMPCAMTQIKREQELHEMCRGPPCADVAAAAAMPLVQTGDFGAQNADRTVIMPSAAVATPSQPLSPGRIENRNR